MNSQELRALQEAYSQVYQLDEISPEVVLAASKAADKKGKPAQASRLYKKFAARDQAANYAAYQRSSVNNEAVDLYDIILSHLLDEGYADTEQAAEAIMVNMSEDWRGSIVEGIAGRAANAVGHQRAGTLGDDDEIRKNQDATSASIGKMKRGSGAKVTPTLPGV